MRDSLKAFTMVTLTIVLTLGLAVTAEAGGQQGRGNELTIYYTQMREQMEPLLRAFSNRHPEIAINDFRSSGEEMATKIEMELRANNPQFDVVLAANNAIADIQRRYDPFAPFVPTEVNSLMPGLIDRNNIQIPVGVGFYVIVHNTNHVSSAEAPRAWADLLNPRWMNRIAIADPRSSASIYGFIWYITQYLQGRPYGWDYFTNLQALNPNYVASHGTIGELVAMGERPIGVQVMATAQSSMARGDPVNTIFPSDGMPSELIVATVRRNTPNQRAAELFVNFLLSREGQQYVSNNLGFVPVRNDIDFVFANGVRLADANLVSRDVYWIADNRESIIERFRRLME